MDWATWGIDRGLVGRDRVLHSRSQIQAPWYWQLSISPKLTVSFNRLSLSIYFPLGLYVAFYLLFIIGLFTLQERGLHDAQFCWDIIGRRLLRGFKTTCLPNELRAYGGDGGGGKWQRRWLWKKRWCSVAKMVNLSSIGSVVFSQKVRSETRRWKHQSWTIDTIKE